MQKIEIDATRLANVQLPGHFEKSGVVITIGNFDGVHLGHRALLKQVRDVAETRQLHSAVLTFEPHPREFFKVQSSRQRLTTQTQKKQLLEWEGLDLLVVATFDQAMAELSPESFVNKLLIDALKVRHLIVGDDFCFGHRRQGDFTSLKCLSAGKDLEIETMDTHSSEGERVSSSLIRSCIAAGDLLRARKLLGRWHVLGGRVQSCLRTANGYSLLLQIEAGQAPAFGRYRVKLKFNGRPMLFSGVADMGANSGLVEVGIDNLENSHVAHGCIAEMFFLYPLIGLRQTEAGAQKYLSSG
ncbi:MAG: bifunctional riboflavin kinase/FAD synthetase [Gammaproteobacteria bacterium HGW-Gammaproteobacteria-11]|nr:MAG: bifunctional riboflavin kinase/FAD synthetase [Gammaproteobacteria bacterium HGW-Gammaproteobacteria-11]